MQSSEWYRVRAYASSLSADEKKTVRQDYEEITGKRFNTAFSPSCPNKYQDAITLILLRMSTKEKEGYILKRGVIIKYHGKTYSLDSVPAVAAEAYIAEGFAKGEDRRTDFEMLANDWESYEPKSKK